MSRAVQFEYNYTIFFSKYRAILFIILMKINNIHQCKFVVSWEADLETKFNSYIFCIQCIISIMIRMIFETLT